ncbi:MAG: Uma2 family endonuclease [Bryobacterales bacterium]|nr:Uma2 family endonuclease [Bryobacterales bacterium]
MGAAMSTGALMDVEEYLHTVFDGADCEYLDGEIVERNAGELPHASVLGNLIYLLAGLKPKLGLQVIPVIRIRIRERRYRVADIAVWRAGDIGKRIPTVPPFLAIEILSAEDRMVRMLPKVQEYLSIGTEWIWVIDPEERMAIIYSRNKPAGVVSDILRTEDPAIEISVADALAPQA